MKKMVVILICVIFSGKLLHAQIAPVAFNQCKACHKVVAGQNGVGPSLFAVYGKKAGQANGYKYSDKHLQSNLLWDEKTLTKYLADPKGTIPGNKMAFAGVKRPDDVKLIVDYLKTLK